MARLLWNSLAPGALVASAAASILGQKLNTRGPQEDLVTSCASTPSRSESFDTCWRARAFGEVATGTVLAATLAAFENPRAVAKGPGDARTLGWVRVDDVVSNRAGSSAGLQGHAIADSLSVRADAIKFYRMYLREDGREVKAAGVRTGRLHLSFTTSLRPCSCPWKCHVSHCVEAGGGASVWRRNYGASRGGPWRHHIASLR